MLPCPLLHVGMPKTGSTSLQKNFFGAHPQFSHFSLRSLYGHEPYWELARRVFDLILAETRNENALRAVGLETQTHLERVARTGKTLVFSNEGLTSHRRFPPREEKAQRLQRVFPTGKVLIVIRNPVDLLVSKYRQAGYRMNERGERMSIPFSEWAREQVRIIRKPISSASNLLFFHFVEPYLELYGRDNVQVLLAEEYRDDPALFLSRIVEHAGLVGADVEEYVGRPENVSASKSFVVDNPYLVSPDIDEETARMINDVALEHCQRIKGIWDLPLEKHGYPV